MNKKDLLFWLSILKSQKLLDYYWIDIVYKNDLKFYQVYFKTYTWKYHVLDFKKTKNKLDIKNIIYQNYILN